MRRLLTILIAAIALASLIRGPVLANELTVEQREAFESVIRDYLLENPEVIVEALAVYQSRQTAAEAAAGQAALQELKPRLVADDNTPIGGNPEGDVNVVEFFDYRCGFCKRVGPDVQALIENDAGVRFVYKEWPILGPESVFAARAALASREQGLYDAYHEALMSAPAITEASVLRIAEEVGLDIERLQADMAAPEVDEHLALTHELATRLGINGTPAFVIGDELVKGAISGQRMAELVEAARASDQP